MSRRNDWDVEYAIEELVLHRDERGGLYEALRFSTQRIPQGGQVYIYTVASKARRGDHYHESKTEWFTCVSGRVRLFMKTKSGVLVDRVLSAESPSMVFAGLGTAHAVQNEEDEEAVIVAYASKEFDRLNPDTNLKRAGG